MAIRPRAWQKTAITVAALAVGSIIGCSDHPSEAAATTTTAQSGLPAETITPTPETTTTTAATTTTRATTTTTTTTVPAFSTPIEITGRGDDVVDVEIPGDSAAIVTFVHDGRRNFAVWSYDRSGGRIDLLVNTIGAYRGTRPINFLVGEEVAFLEVNGDGSWTMLVEPLTAAPIVSAGGTRQGEGDAVLVDPYASSSAARVSFTHDGQRNVAVWGWANRRSLLVNHIGPYDGTVLAEANTVVYDIRADGKWTIAVSR